MESRNLQSKEQLINQFSALIPFVEALAEMDDDKWAAPIEAGKWSTRDVIAHIMLWDKYFFEEAIEKISNHQAVTVQHIDYNEFNRNAVEFAKFKEKQEIINLAIHYRNEILSHLGRIPEEDFPKEHLDGDGSIFSVYTYVVDFIPHDTGHINQLKSFLARG
jgi:hypothetical protein